MAHHSCTNTNTSSNETFDQVLKRGLKDPSRRLLIKGGVGLASVVTLPMLNACADSESTPSALKNLPSSSLLGFSPTAKSLLDSVVVPAGYTVSVLHATGDRLRSSKRLTATRVQKQMIGVNESAIIMTACISSI